MAFKLATISRFLLRHIRIVGIVVAVLVLLIGSVTLIVPRYRQANATRGINYSQKQATLQNQQAYLAKLQKLAEEVKGVSQDDIDRLDALVPRTKDIPGIFKQMQAFATQAGMQLLSVSVADGGILSSSGTATSTSSTLKTLNISVVLNGALDYARLKTFLSVVSNQAPLLDLTAISHTSTDSTSTPTTYNFIFRSYYLSS